MAQRPPSRWATVASCLCAGWVLGVLAGIGKQSFVPVPRTVQPPAAQLQLPTAAQTAVLASVLAVPQATPCWRKSRVASSGASALCLAIALAGSSLWHRGSSLRRRRTAVRALTEIAQVKLNLPAGKATPAPPVGPALGQYGANIAFFCKEYNALTADKAGTVIPVIIHIFNDRSYTLELKTPPTATLLHEAIGSDRGGGRAQDPIGKISIDKLREIAEIKLQDLNVEDIWRAMKIVHGTARASGITVEGYDEWLKTIFPKPKSIMDRYGPGKAKLPPPFNEGTWQDTAPPAEE